MCGVCGRVCRCGVCGVCGRVCRCVVCVDVPVGVWCEWTCLWCVVCVDVCVGVWCL